MMAEVPPRAEIQFPWTWNMSTGVQSSQGMTGQGSASKFIHVAVG